jgi:hypothetical protein
VSGEPLNPYASPVIPTEEAGIHFDDLGLVATFFMEEEDQRASIEVIPVSLSPWLLMTGGLGIVAAVATFAYALDWFVSEEIIALASLFALLFVGLLFIVQYDHTRRARNAALQTLRLHPLLGVCGPWQLIVSPDRLIVENSAGSQSFARRRTQIWNTEHQLVIFFGGQPIVIPSREPYAAMCRELRQRLWQLAQQDKETASQPANVQ